MITVDYEIYINDYTRSYKKETFYNLGAFVDWVFQNCDDDYKSHIFVPDPEDKRAEVMNRLPYRIQVSRCRTRGNSLWVHQIRRDNTIIFSDGKHTNNITHWNEEVKQMCRDMLTRIKNPVFNFG